MVPLEIAQALYLTDAGQFLVVLLGDHLLLHGGPFGSCELAYGEMWSRQRCRACLGFHGDGLHLTKTPQILRSSCAVPLSPMQQQMKQSRNQKPHPSAPHIPTIKPTPKLTRAPPLAPTTPPAIYHLLNQPHHLMPIWSPPT
jgi:hypothetical protein